MSGFHTFKTLVLRRRLMDTERPTPYYYQQLFHRSIPGLENPERACWMETDALGCPLPLWQDHDKNYALCRVLGRPFSFTLCGCL